MATLLTQDHRTLTSVTDNGAVLTAGEDYVAIPPIRDDEPFSALVRLVGGWSGPVDIVGRFGWAVGTPPIAPEGVRECTILMAFRFYKRRQSDFGRESGMVTMGAPIQAVDPDALALLIPFEKPRYQGRKPVRLS